MNQHFVSKVILRRFSPPNKKGLIHILEKPNKEFLYQSIAKNAACIINYNIIEINGKKSNILEEIACDIEREVGRVIEKINSNNCKINNNDWSNIILLGAFLYLNVPHIRKNIEKFEKSKYQLIAKILGSDKSMLQNYIEKIDLSIIDKNKIDLKKLINFLKNKNRNKIIVSKEKIIFNALNQISFLYNILINMHWDLYLLIDNSYFITSDTPIVPMARNWKFPFAPGIKIAHQVIFPLTKKVCAIGQWTERKSSFEVNYLYANLVNISMMKYSRYLYSPLTFNELNGQFNKF